VLAGKQTGRYAWRALDAHGGVLQIVCWVLAELWVWAGHVCVDAIGWLEKRPCYGKACIGGDLDVMQLHASRLDDRAKNSTAT
jgi:hypothetical protein